MKTNKIKYERIQNMKGFKTLGQTHLEVLLKFVHNFLIYVTNDKQQNSQMVFI